MFWKMFYKQKEKNRIIEIPITYQMRIDAKKFCEQVIKEKMKESHHKKDSNHEWKRWNTGVLGEMALEKFLKRTFRDNTIGDSKYYDIPDLSPLNLQIGVKSFRVGNFPLVNRSNFISTGIRKKLDGQVFIGISQDLKRAYLFGVAFDEQLYKNERNPNNNRFVKDKNALKRKVAFTDFDSLHTFHSFKDLQKLAEKHHCVYKPKFKQKPSIMSY